MNNCFVSSRLGKGHRSSFARNPMVHVTERSTFPFGYKERKQMGLQKLISKLLLCFLMFPMIGSFCYLCFLFTCFLFVNLENSC